MRVDADAPPSELRQRRTGAGTPAGGEGASAATGDDEAKPKTEAELEREHQLQLQLEFKKKRNKLVGGVFGLPLGLFALGLMTGVITVSKPKDAIVCADISDRDLCAASEPDCCYDTLSRNCSVVDECTPGCADGYESYGNLGVEPCIQCEPGFADTDWDPTTPCAECDPV